MKPVDAKWVVRASALLLLPALPALGADSAPLSGADSLLRLIGALVFILALIMALGWLGRRFGLPGRSRGTGLLRSVDAIQLGPRERIVLLAIENRRVLVGLSGGRMTRLGEYTADADASELEDAAERTGTVSQSTETTSASEPRPPSGDAFTRALRGIQDNASGVRS
ncbi:MAG: flagellar biosynthetic protein FliO [Gammaproteobacteria bacterium]